MNGSPTVDDWAVQAQLLSGDIQKLTPWRHEKCPTVSLNLPPEWHGR